ncbi:hypothetical protein [Pseudorhodoplanes sp.]|uniref:hypothetical protein n=1 Tax=Pseudorhodoplanes sp. TaxID=1934341 RepID=UPI002B91098E|nr:hypothetical protein [Pseudorhodoplanes sp.]HWV55652.1 hypothetical protein [Pseudorhodoplanes sp.]
MNRIVVAATALLIAASTASAQKDEGRGDGNKDLTNCPPASSQQTTGSASDDANAVEKSAILPSAEGHEKSAAPTVQRDGQSVEARTDCPQDSGQPKPNG